MVRYKNTILLSSNNKIKNKKGMIIIKILALDQGSNITGFSILNNEELIKYGVFNIKDEKNINERIDYNKLFLDKLYSTYKPDMISIEDIQQQKNPLTFKKLAHLQGLLINYLHINGIPYMILKPSEWRSKLGIKGAKREIQKRNSIKYILNKYNIDVTDDESDSICIGLASYKIFNSKKRDDYLKIWE